MGYIEGELHISRIGFCLFVFVLFVQPKSIHIFSSTEPLGS